MKLPDSPAAGIQQAYRTAYLIAGHLKGTLSDGERLELAQWINESEHNRLLFAELTAAGSCLRINYTMIKNILISGMDKQVRLPIEQPLPPHDNIRGPQQYQ